MLRGGDRTISDGEKSVIAFCYFLAQCHLRVESNEEYKKLFLVFDDPVTSMSYDYIYSIIQCLKLLRISEEGEIQFNLQSNLYKPRMLILTHNSYFFNIASTNRLVRKQALYQLAPNAQGSRVEESDEICYSALAPARGRVRRKPGNERSGPHNREFNKISFGRHMEILPT